MLCLLVLALAVAPSARAQYTQGVFFGGGTAAYIPYIWPRNDCCGVVLFNQKDYGYNGTTYPGAYNIFGEPLVYSTVVTNDARSFAVELVNTGNINGSRSDSVYAKIILADGEAGFNSWSNWQSGAPGNNAVLFVCCGANSDFKEIEVTYNTYDPASSTVSFNAGPPLAPFYIWRGGQGQAFNPQVYGENFTEGLPSPDNIPYYGVGSTIGGRSFLYWASWDVGQGAVSNVWQDGNVGEYLGNYGGALGQMQNFTVPGWIPMYDFDW
jgi:hypothetical protein